MRSSSSTRGKNGSRWPKRGGWESRSSPLSIRTATPTKWITSFPATTMPSGQFACSRPKWPMRFWKENRANKTLPDPSAKGWVRGFTPHHPFLYNLAALRIQSGSEGAGGGAGVRGGAGRGGPVRRRRRGGGRGGPPPPPLLVPARADRGERGGGGGAGRGGAAEGGGGGGGAEGEGRRGGVAARGG